MNCAARDWTTHIWLVEFVGETGFLPDWYHTRATALQAGAHARKHWSKNGFDAGPFRAIRFNRVSAQAKTGDKP